jgi:hypothetical protein
MLNVRQPTAVPHPRTPPFDLAIYHWPCEQKKRKTMRGDDEIFGGYFHVGVGTVGHSGRRLAV